MIRLAPASVALASKLALGVASLILALSLTEAWRIAEVPAAPQGERYAATAFGSVASSSAPERPAAPHALAGDPFSPDHLLPQSDVPDAPTADDAPPPQPAIPMRLLGTVVRGDSGFAVCQLGNEPPRMVRVGERFGVLTLLALQQGRAVFRASDGSRVELSLTKPEI
ncbi:MAG TPA: hypothetical protein VHM30_13380 [Gemmatimonadaceae bacterium]|nr:hypothetical protein [Gemmatimonadaceae bacterium]